MPYHDRAFFRFRRPMSVCEEEVADRERLSDAHILHALYHGLYPAVVVALDYHYFVELKLSQECRYLSVLNAGDGRDAVLEVADDYEIVRLRLLLQCVKLLCQPLRLGGHGYARPAYLVAYAKVQIRNCQVAIREHSRLVVDEHAMRMPRTY